MLTPHSRFSLSLFGFYRWDTFKRISLTVGNIPNLACNYIKLCKQNCTDVFETLTVEEKKHKQSFIKKRQNKASNYKVRLCENNFNYFVFPCLFCQILQLNANNYSDIWVGLLRNTLLTKQTIILVVLELWKDQKTKPLQPLGMYHEYKSM